MDVRKVHGITIKDDLAWMEKMDSSKWKKFIKDEQETYSSFLDPLRNYVEGVKRVLESSGRISSQLRFSKGNVSYGHSGTLNYKWKFNHIETIYTCAALFPEGDFVWSIEDTGSGKENYKISCYSEQGVKWSYEGVGPFVTVIEDRCYSLLAKNTLIYYKIVSWDKYSGSDFRVHYEEKDKKYNLSIQGETFVVRQSGTFQDLFEITSSSLKVLEGIVTEPRRFVCTSIPGLYLMWSSRKGWQASKKTFILPSWSTATPETLEGNLLVTKWYGTRTLYRLSKKSPEIIWQGIGEIMIRGNDVRIRKPGCRSIWWNNRSRHNPFDTFPKKHQLSIRKAKSKDGTIVPFVLLMPHNPKGLLIIGYSAYGMSTGLSTSRWNPFLYAGYALVIGMFRGGGDHTPEWEDAGRLEGRENTLEDSIAVVREARHICHIPANKTILYGRSAGGLWVGGCIARYPTGNLAGCAYMEVPYLDVLRTTTNPELPLTDLETDEFGNPNVRISDFKSVLAWSPMELLVSGTPGVNQLVRTGLNDSEVFAYESAKWVVRSRRLPGSTVLLAVEGEQGHFISGKKGLEQQAQDIVLLMEFINKTEK